MIGTFISTNILTSDGVIHIASINEVFTGCLTSPYGPVTTSSILSLVFLKEKGAVTNYCMSTRYTEIGTCIQYLICGTSEKQTCFEQRRKFCMAVVAAQVKKAEQH